MGIQALEQGPCCPNLVLPEVLEETVAVLGGRLDDFPVAQADRKVADVQASGDDGHEARPRSMLTSVERGSIMGNRIGARGPAGGPARREKP
jgi:hypothetical protein